MDAGQGRGIVTPEAVQLDFEDAGVGSRAVALMIDWAVQLAVLATTSLAVSLLPTGQAWLPGWVGVMLAALLGFLVLLGYPTAFETFARGRTPGKMVMGLRVITLEGAPVTFRHAAVRAALGLVDFAMTSGVAAVVSALVSRRHQRLGDHIAGTVVVRERTGAGAAQAATFTVPVGYESYAATIDPAGLRPEDYEAVRAFLLRASSLAPPQREALARRLARTVAGRASHQIPEGMHPEVVLRCAAARYQGRSHGRAAGSAAGQQAPAPRDPAGGPPASADDGQVAADQPLRSPEGGFAAPG